MGCKGFTGKHTEETKLKISKANSGRKYTEEEWIKRGKSKESWDKRKENALLGGVSC